MVREDTCVAARRTHTIKTLLAAVAACAAAALAGGPDASAATGGLSYVDPPVISKLQCRTRCAGTTSARRRGVVAVKQGAVLVVRGRRLRQVRRVVFLGGRGKGDNVSRAARRVRRLSLKVRVPRSAKSGRIRLVDEAGRRSRASRARLRIIRSGPRLIWPVRGMLTGRFGEDRGDHIHAGIDIAAPTGRAIRAVAGGRVTLRGWVGGYGRYVCIAHRRLSSCYAHMSRFGTTRGARVGQGEIVGRVGSTGNSTGPHLHFEIRRGRRPWGTPLNPLRFLPRRGRASAAAIARPMDYDLPIFGP